MCFKVAFFICDVLAARLSATNWSPFQVSQYFWHLLDLDCGFIICLQYNGFQLTYQMLPPSVAKVLYHIPSCSPSPPNKNFQEYQQQKSMNAVKYDSVTIYFSDLVDFIQMVEESSPSEVIIDYFQRIFTIHICCALDGNLPELFLQDVRQSLEQV